MHRLSLRVPDIILAALRRELENERAFRGRRYSLNDLCVRKLGVNGHAGQQQPDASGTLVIPRVPPPPPVPVRSTAAPMWFRDDEGVFRAHRDEPQPERAIRIFNPVDPINPLEPQPAAEVESDTPSQHLIMETPSEVVMDGPAADGADQVVNESASFEQAAVESFEDEGGAPDGHLDH